MGLTIGSSNGSSMDLPPNSSPPRADSGVLLSLLGPTRYDRTHPGGRRCSELRGQGWILQLLSGWEG